MLLPGLGYRDPPSSPLGYRCCVLGGDEPIPSEGFEFTVIIDGRSGAVVYDAFCGGPCMAGDVLF